MHRVLGFKSAASLQREKSSIWITADELWSPQSGVFSYICRLQWVWWLCNKKSLGIVI